MNVVTIIGARPQFIKASVVNSEIRKRSENRDLGHNREIIVHTGQHYDYNMSRVFFDELDIPEPHYHLEVGSGSHGSMTARMMSKIEEVLNVEHPDWVLVYGDTNSTLAGAIVAAKMHIPIAHVEAGLRSFNKRMPEELNRVLTDHMSEALFTPTEIATANLVREGITEGVILTGDVMFDAFLQFKEKAAARSRILDTLDLSSGSYCLATVHRQENTDDCRRLTNIFSALKELSYGGQQIVLPLHPRTRKALEQNNICIDDNTGIRVIEAVGYLDMIHLEANAGLICTDSGGVQKEAYFAGVPCITLRDETEWVETVEAGANILAGAEKQAILNACTLARNTNVTVQPGLYGDGDAAAKIVDSFDAKH
ncbi:non-hydrolyzing UDP-N-acetylglucosamine 2-epimerase [Desulfosediminicola ganghwensis]|uniref:non-hydrolyzing UDP-N-acetylglucosamine 2-epimerase n=1 Tax=Desulfosediminicola ganghwensis TaxID=2569540 RepID=UPI0010AC21D5|nr:UDP-N-acetylglucosamine 2-epimerase (non-hydrolyzing) [Desulfosediminicola ganghwensis]